MKRRLKVPPMKPLVFTDQDLDVICQALYGAKFFLWGSPAAVNVDERCDDFQRIIHMIRGIPEPMNAEEEEEFRRECLELGLVVD